MMVPNSDLEVVSSSEKYVDEGGGFPAEGARTGGCRARAMR